MLIKNIMFTQSSELDRSGQESNAISLFDIAYLSGFTIIILSIATVTMMLLAFPIREINFILKILITSQFMFMTLLISLRCICYLFNKKEEDIVKKKSNRPIMFKYFNNLVHRNEPVIKRNKKSFFPFY